MFSSQSKWIGGGNGRISPMIHRTFTAKKAHTTVYISGLGFFELYINGQRVGNDCFVPAFSDYLQRPLLNLCYPTCDRMEHRVYVLEYDITQYLQDGENKMEILLGDGWWRQTDRIGEGRLHFGETLCARYEVFCGEEMLLCSDGSETFTDSFIQKSSLFCGEIQDFAANTAKHYPVTVLDDFCQRYEKQTCPADKVMATVVPTLLHTADGKAFYDAGKNLSGRVRLISAGGDVTVRHAEELNENGLDFRFSGDYQIQQDEYHNTKPGDVLYTHFRWSAFRYFEITGAVQQVQVEEIYSDVAVTADFQCSDETINFYYQAFINAYLANMHCGVPSDCPHRERLGYTGDGQLTCETGLLTTDAELFYRKWLEDIYDCQDIETGHVQHTAPFNGGGGGPGGWGGAIAIVPEALYRMTGDRKILVDALPRIDRYLDCMATFCEDGLVVRELAGGMSLGDWCVPGYQVHIPESYVNTYFYIRCMQIADDFRAELGQPAQYEAQIQTHKQRLIAAFYDAEADSFCGSVEGADLFAIDLGIAPASLVEKTARRYAQEPSVDTGIFGTELLLKFLSAPQYVDTFIKVLSNRAHPSFGYMQAHGATTLWETWEGNDSHNHPMLGGGVKYLFYGLLGVCPDAQRKQITITPVKQSQLSFISGKLTLWGNTLTVRYDYQPEGICASVWAQQASGITLVYDGKEYPVAQGENTFTFLYR